jgi:serine/threonine-protein kinase
MPESPTGAFDPQNAPTVPESANVAIESNANLAATGDRRGHFRLVRRHAQGGLGLVSVAHDAKLDRQVALKELRPDRRDSATLRQRFLTEAAITGQLEHPGIVPVYALDEQDGQPFYAMRFIEGRTLSEAIRDYHSGCLDKAAASLAFRDLLQRFVSVCQTIAYAHSKDVIHRDLKPANIMLGQFGETLVVDWGLAKKLTSPPEAPASDTTKETTDYRPDSDQSRLTQAGQVLGTAAYLSPEQASGDPNAVGPPADVFALGAILYELLTGQPPYIGSHGAEVVAMARLGRIAPPEQVRRGVPKPLAAVCRKALAATVAERYATAKDLADDVTRWLADEPVTAYAAPWTDRARRWLRRHRTLAVSGGVFLVMTLLALSGTIVLVAGHNAELQRANADLKAANDRERALADLGQGTMEQLTDDKALNYLKRLPVLATEQKEFLRRAASYYEKFAAFSSQDEKGRSRQADAYHHMADLQGYLGENQAAESANRKALELYEKLANDFPTVQHYLLGVVMSHNSHGSYLREMGKRAEAEAAFRQAITMTEKLVKDSPDTSNYCWELARGNNNLAIVLDELGQRAEAEALLHRALALEKDVVAANPKDEDYRYDFANSHILLGALLFNQGKYAEAEPMYRRAAEILGKLAAEFPTVSQYRRELAGCHDNLGILLAALGKRDDAEAAYRQGLVLREQLVADFPAVADLRHQLARSCNNIGILLTTSASPGTAEEWYRKALALQERVAADFPSVPQYRLETASSYNNLAYLMQTLHREAEAEVAYRQALAIQEKMVADYPAVPEYRTLLAGGYFNFGSLVLKESRLGGPAASLAWTSKAIALLDPLVAKEHALARERLFLRNAHMIRARALTALNRHADALKDWDKALALNDVPEHLLRIRVDRATTLARLGDHAKAVAEANAVADAKDVTGSKTCEAAGICALAAAAVKDDSKLQEQYAARAVELLRLAVSKGYKDLDSLGRDDTLKVLREREDYRRLLKDLEEKK